MDSAKPRRGNLFFSASWILAVSIAAACGSGDEITQRTRRVRAPKTSTDHRWTASPEWVDFYQPERADAGFNLILYGRRIPLLMDMNGEVVHAWANVRASGRARFLPTGHLAVIAESGGFEEYDWEGQLSWSFSLEDPATFLHHDFIQLANGNFLLLAHDPAVEADFLLEIDRSGAVIWRWNSNEPLAKDLPRAGLRNNKTHINSVYELPSNRWFDQGLEQFKPGNILISARNLNALYVVARPDGQVVWRYYDGLDYQHEAIMIPPGRQGSGNIVFFNNGYNDLYAFRQSAIIELNPAEDSVVWEFRKRGFYSSTGGTQQSLSNGNLLVTSSQGGRVFELARDGRIVWQWSPPYLPMRVSRYPYNFSPQFQRLGKPAATAIDRRDPDRFVDANLYAFGLPHESRRVKEGNRTRLILKIQNRCQILQLPADAKLRLGYGSWRQDTETPYVSEEVRYVATVRGTDSSDSETLLDRKVGGDELEPRNSDDRVRILQETVSLNDYASRSVELCLNLTSAAGGPAPDDFVWEEPAILAPDRWAQFERDSKLDPEAVEQQEKHLKAIGYIN